MAFSRLQWAATAAKRGDVTGSLAAARAAVEILEPLVQKSSEDRIALSALSEAHLLLGRILNRRGDDEKALMHWEQAAERIESIAAGSSNKRFLDPWARALIRLGRLDEARPVIEKLSSFGYREPAFLELTHLLQD